MLAGLGAGRDTGAAGLESGYLHGTWVLGNTACTDQASEFVSFRESGAFENTHAGRLQAAGFWVVNGDVVEAHLVASPAFFEKYFEAQGNMQELASSSTPVRAFRLRIVPLNMQQDQFDAVGLLGDQVAQAVFRRCTS